MKGTGANKENLKGFSIFGMRILDFAGWRPQIRNYRSRLPGQECPRSAAPTECRILICDLANLTCASTLAIELLMIALAFLDPRSRETIDDAGPHQRQ